MLLLLLHFTAYRRGYIIPRPGRFALVASSSLPTPPFLARAARSFFIVYLLDTSAWKCASASLHSLSHGSALHVPEFDLYTSIIHAAVFTVLH